MPGILLTARSYAEPTAKVTIIAGYSTRRDLTAHKPAVIHITASYLKPLVKVSTVN